MFKDNPNHKEFSDIWSFARKARQLKTATDEFINMLDEKYSQPMSEEECATRTLHAGMPPIDLVPDHYTKKIEDEQSDFRFPSLAIKVILHYHTSAAPYPEKAEEAGGWLSYFIKKDMIFKTNPTPNYPSYYKLTMRGVEFLNNLRATPIPGTESYQDEILKAFKNERLRQIEKLGWTKEHDKRHGGQELAWAAATYCLSSMPPIFVLLQRLWPWFDVAYKPKSHRENLIRAGALIMAELERIKS